MACATEAMLAERSAAALILARAVMMRTKPELMARSIAVGWT